MDIANSLSAVGAEFPSLNHPVHFCGVVFLSREFHLALRAETKLRKVWCVYQLGSWIAGTTQLVN